MTHPRGGIKAWPMDVSGQPWRAVFTPDPAGGQLRSSGQWCSLILPSALPCFFPPWVDPKGNPDKHPSTKLHLSLHPREPACNMYQKTFQHSRRIFIWKLLATHVLITFFFNFILFLNFTILYWFCQISKWICHRYTRVPHPEPSSLPIPSLWVVPVHQPQASSIVHQTWTGNSFHIWYYTYFNAILPNHPTLSLSHRVQKTVLYISVSFAVSYTGLLLPSF